MFCPCAGSYFRVEGLQTEKPRLVRSRDHQVPTSRSRASLPMQIRPHSARGNIQRREYRQAEANMYGPVSSYSRQGPYVKSRPVYGLRGYHGPPGILKVLTDEFPFDYEIPRRLQPVQEARTDETSHVPFEVGSPNPIRSRFQPPASEVVKVRVYRRGRSTSPCRQEDITVEKVQFRRGDIIVHDARAHAFTTSHIEPVRKMNSPTKNWNSTTQDRHTQTQEWRTPTQEWNSPTQEWNTQTQGWNSPNQDPNSPSQHWKPAGGSQW
ncbi:hypothetical protein BDW71DRAFT_160920 [Aspergillus fruticulosus]